MTPVGRDTVNPGTPGTPGTPDPDPAGAPVSGRPARPPWDKAETGAVIGPLDGKAQLAGTDIDPSLPARARVAAMLPRPAPGPDAAPLS